MEESRLCKNCGKKEHCKWTFKGTCDLWQTEERELKLESTDGYNYDFEEVD